MKSWLIFPATCLVAGFALGHGVAFAQTGQTPGPADIWQMLFTSGPLAVCLGVALYRVDLERRTMLREKDALLERVLMGLNNVTTSINSIGETSQKILQAFDSLSRYFNGRGDKL